MMLKNQIEVDNTRAKLGRLEAQYEELRTEGAEDEEVREMTMESLKRLIVQFKEEIARYEAHQTASRCTLRRFAMKVSLDNTSLMRPQLDTTPPLAPPSPSSTPKTSPPPHQTPPPSPSIE